MSKWQSEEKKTEGGRWMSFFYIIIIKLCWRLAADVERTFIRFLLLWSSSECAHTHTHKIRQNKGEGEKWSEHAQCSVIVPFLPPPSFFAPLNNAKCSATARASPSSSLRCAVLCRAASESESVEVLLSFRVDCFSSLSSPDDDGFPHFHHQIVVCIASSVVDYSVSQLKSLIRISDWLLFTYLLTYKLRFEQFEKNREMKQPFMKRRSAIFSLSFFLLAVATSMLFVMPQVDASGSLEQLVVRHLSIIRFLFFLTFLFGLFWSIQ